MCPQLAVLLKIKYNILSVGTCRSNRKGWPKAIMNMKKKTTVKRATIRFATIVLTKSVACNGEILR